MLAIIRVRDKGRSYHLCDLDLLRFTEDQVRQRMYEKGIRDDTFFIQGFRDWSIDVQMSLKQAYLLKRSLIEIYDHDDFIIRHLLERGFSVKEIVSTYYSFIGKDEEEVMCQLMKGVELVEVIHFWKNSQTWVNALNQYIAQKQLLNTQKGFYQLQLVA